MGERQRCRDCSSINAIAPNYGPLVLINVQNWTHLILGLQWDETGGFQREGSRFYISVACAHHMLILLQ